MKKILSLFLAAILVFSAIPLQTALAAPEDEIGAEVPSEALIFTDLAGYEWAEAAIYDLVETGIINGMGGTIFAPGGTLTRAQFAKMIVLALDGKEPEASAAGTFPDVAAGIWHAVYVERAAALGLITGYTDGTFGPERSVTKEEMFTILVRAMGHDEAAKKLNGKGLEVAGYAPGESISAWALGYVEMAEDLGLIEHGNVASVSTVNGAATVSLSGKTPANRAEAAASVGRMAARLYIESTPAA